MSDLPRGSSPLSLLTLRTVRTYIRQSHAVMMTAFFAIVYALGSMVLGSMLLLTPLTPPYYSEILWSGGAPAWNYPGLLIVQPWGVVTLPFFPTVAMIIVSVGVGIGMAVAVLLGVALIRHRRARAGQPAAVGSVAGLTPAMIALVTLGACCSTTAAATAGVGLVGQLTGTSTENLLLNNWFLGVFQIVVVWIALFAQELLLRVYGGLFGSAAVGIVSIAGTASPRPIDRKVAASAALRIALMIGAVTWSLAMVASWTTISPSGASPTLWFSWIVQHQLVAIFAIVAALFPRGLAQAVGSGVGTLGVRILRGALLIAGFSLVIGVPPPLASAGAAGFVNQLLAVWGGSTAWGASAPMVLPVSGLYFSWGMQFLLLGGFAIAVGLEPRRALSFLGWSTAGPVPDSRAARAEGADNPPEVRPTGRISGSVAPASAADSTNPPGGPAHM